MLTDVNKQFLFAGKQAYQVQIFQAHTNELTLCTIILTSSLSET